MRLEFILETPDAGSEIRKELGLLKGEGTQGSVGMGFVSRSALFFPHPISPTQGPIDRKPPRSPNAEGGGATGPTASMGHLPAPPAGCADPGQPWQSPSQKGKRLHPADCRGMGNRHSAQDPKDLRGKARVLSGANLILE